MAHPAGFEPATPRSEVACSIQLSYECVLVNVKSFLCKVELLTITLRSGVGDGKAQAMRGTG
jgi:hypothetical protein